MSDRASSSSPILQVENLTHVYRRKGQPALTAVDHVSFQVDRGECLGLVGESGCGKSTTANMVLRLLDVTEGAIRLVGTDITYAKGAGLREAYRTMQSVFQDPQQSFDPRRTLGYSVAEPLRNQGVSKSAAKTRAVQMLRRCGLPDALATRYPNQVSGGQCQRAAIARALMVRPKLLICDEATSALDVTVQRHIVELLADLRTRDHLSLLFISHDLALVAQLCDRIAVMRAGRIVETGATERVVNRPNHPYTRELLQAVW